MQHSGDFEGAEFLRTRRVVLRGLRVADVPALIALNSDPEVARWLLEPCPTGYWDVVGLVFQANECSLLHPGLGSWHGSDEQGRFVGMFTLAPRADGSGVEMGMRLPRSVWGRLYPIEVGRALCEHAFESLRLPLLLGMCHPQNAAVPAILRRLGFSADGEEPYFSGRGLRHVLHRDAWLASRSVRLPQREHARALEE